MASQNQNMWRAPKRRSSATSDGPIKRLVAPFLKQEPSEGQPTSSGQNNAPGPSSLPSKWVLEQAATTTLLQWFGRFVCRRCPMIPSLGPRDPVRWILSVDRALYLQGWQTERFLTPANVIFLYSVCREAISCYLASRQELRAALMAALYVSFAYTGVETSYPVRLFLGGSQREEFWTRCLAVVQATSAKMLRMHTDPAYFAQTFAHLKAAGKDVEDRLGQTGTDWGRYAS